MPITRLENLIASKTGRFLYVAPDDFNASDSIDNRGNSPTRPFVSIQRAFLEVSRFSYVPSTGNDRFDQFSIILSPGDHFIDNRPGVVNATAAPSGSLTPALFTPVLDDNSNFDLNNPNNVLYKFNSTEGGVIVPRGTSLVGVDLRKTKIRPKYVPEPTSTLPQTSIFKVTGGCYFWQFSLFDGQGSVYYDPTTTNTKAPEYSHHKVVTFEFAKSDDLVLYYKKISTGYSGVVNNISISNEIAPREQENRIVGPLSDKKSISSIKLVQLNNAIELEVTTKSPHNYFVGQFVSISDTGLNNLFHGAFPVSRISTTNTSIFYYEVPTATLLANINLNNNFTYTTSTTPALSQNALVEAEIDTVDSASPYVFNCSLRSVWGLCGMHADGSRTTGFRSMVVAQFTGVSLQKDDRSFVKFDTNTELFVSTANNNSSFDSSALHSDGFAYFKNDWRTFHIRVSNDAFIQAVSVFAVGYADHFLVESGGDISITNSNSNFGNTAIQGVGYKGFAFFQDKHGYITDIIPPQEIEDVETKVQYYPVDIKKSNDTPSSTRVYLYGEKDEIDLPDVTPSYNINGYKLGSKKDDKLFVKLVGDPAAGESGTVEKSAVISPSGFLEFTISSFARVSQTVGTTTFKTTTFTTTTIHGLETGTPVRLVPTKANSSVADSKVRLPKGLSTNTVYYIIAPGRFTSPVNGALPINDSSKFQLAASIEDAAAGTAIYVEQAVADPDVTIKLYQYVFDIIPDLKRYKVTLSNNVFTAESPHVFDAGFGSIEPTKVFFRVADETVDLLPTTTNINAKDNAGFLNKNQEFYVRYLSNVHGATQFQISPTSTGAINGTDIVSFSSNGTGTFYVYAYHNRHPLRYDPSATTTDKKGNWYLTVKNNVSSGEPNEIYSQLSNTNLIDYSQDKLDNTDNSYIKRVEDQRRNSDRIYRVRYVIPKELTDGQNVREPLFGFVLKLRTDETRKLLPQDIVLTPPTSVTAPAEFYSPSEITKAVRTKIENDFNYDAYSVNNKKVINTKSGCKFTVQSAVYDATTNKVKLRVFDHAVNYDSALGTFLTSGVTLTQIKLSSATGTFVPTSGSTVRDINWNGPAGQGTAELHSVTVSGTNVYLLVKNVNLGLISYDALNATTFTQSTAGSVSASGTLAEKPNGGRSDLKDPNYIYVNEGSSLYTLTPGDKIVDDGTNGYEYTIESVADAPDFTDTFYIYKVETIKKRIYQQQDGIYYLTLLKGNISPNLNSTSQNNLTKFNTFQFGQDPENLYPELYLDDPIWFKIINPNLKDPPAAISVADNYIHGKVSLDDQKNSITRESMLNLLDQNNIYRTNITLAAQEGRATSSREDRLIPIEGNSGIAANSKVYCELRRPSVARSGNHTFEYTGFGPGNYSTAFPSRQENVLEDSQVIFSQSKKQNAGVVFYSGLNSNGDLFVGNQRINAITGETTKVSDSVLKISGSKDESGAVTTTFTQPVSFRDNASITLDNSNSTNFILSPIEINVSPARASKNQNAAVLFKSNRYTSTGDQSLEGTNLTINESQPNTIKAAVYKFNSRGGSVNYEMKVHTESLAPTVAGTPYKETGTMIYRANTVAAQSSATDNTSLGWIYTGSTYGWKEFGLIGAEAITTYTTGPTNTTPVEGGLFGTDFRVGINLRNTRSGTRQPQSTLDVEGEARISKNILVGGINTSATSNAAFRMSSTSKRGGINITDSELTDTDIGSNPGFIIKGNLKVKVDAGGTGNLTIDGEEIINGGKLTINNNETAKTKKFEIVADQPSDVNNTITFEGQNLRIGATTSTRLLINSDKSFKIGDPNAGIQSDANSFTSIGLSAVDTNYKLSVGGALRLVDGTTELMTVTTAGVATIRGSLNVTTPGASPTSLFNVAPSTGNTTILGTLEVRKSITLTGSTTPNTELFVINDGASTPATKFQVDSANGNTVVNGGNLNIYASDGTTPKLTLTNTTGNLFVAGTLTATGTTLQLGTSGDLNLEVDSNGNVITKGTLLVKGGELEVRSGANTRFKVNSDGSIRLNTISNYFTATGGRPWTVLESASFSGSGSSYAAAANINYASNFTSGTRQINLPLASHGDMIRILDIGGSLSPTVQLKIQPQAGANIQGAAGPMVIQTPNASFGLVYIVPASGTPSWWLTEV